MWQTASTQRERDTIEYDYDDDDEIMLAASQQYEADTVSLKKMASSRDGDMSMAASMQHERDTIECDYDDDEIMLAASQQYEADLAEQYLKDAAKYHEEDYFLMDNLMKGVVCGDNNVDILKESSCPQRFALAIVL